MKAFIALFTCTFRARADFLAPVPLLNCLSTFLCHHLPSCAHIALFPVSSPINIPFEAGSLDDVEAWAQHEFPAYFAALSTFPIAQHIDISRFDGEDVDGKIVLQPVLISALDVGVSAAGTSIYARITGGNDVELFCGHRVKAYENTEDLWCIKPVT